MNLRTSCGIVKACVSYAHESGEERGVSVSNLSKRKPAVSGSSPLAIMTLEAEKGDILKVRIEGDDELARSLQEDLKKALSGELDLFEQYRERYHRARKSL